MRHLVIAALFGLSFAGSASAADLRYGWDRPDPPAPVQQDDDEEGYERPRWREPDWRRPPPPRVRIEEQDDDEDEPECWIRHTPYGPQKLCRR